MRNIKVEYLRVFFMGCIVLLHALTKGYQYHITSGEIPTGLDGDIVSMLFSFACLGVTGFIFISGYYGIRFKPSKLSSLWLICTFYAIISVIGKYALDESTTVSWGGKQLIFSVLALFNSWWFVTSYCLVMILSPIIEKGIQLINKKQFTIIVVYLILQQYVAEWAVCANSGPSFQKFIIIYLLGRYISLYPPTWIKRHARSLWICNLLLVMIVPPLLHHFCITNLLKYVSTSFFLPYLLIIIGLVLDASKKPVLRKGFFLTQNILAVYLLHDSAFGVNLLWHSKLLAYSQFNLYLLLAIVIGVLLSCTLIDELRKIILRPVERSINKFIENYNKFKI